MPTDILLIISPFTQLNTCYPSICNLSAFLKQHSFNVSQLDLSIETFLQLFSQNSLLQIFNIIEENIESKKKKISQQTLLFLQNKKEYLKYIDTVISFLQGQNQTYDYILINNILPKPLFHKNIDVNLYFGSQGILDRAKYLATCFIEDIGLMINENIDANYNFVRYAQGLCEKIADFSTLENSLLHETFVTKIMNDILKQKIQQTQPKVIGFSVPFPGNFFTTLAAAKYIKQHFKDIKIVVGGGFINTELRNLTETKIFNYTDFVCLDDGEIPLLNIMNHIINKTDKNTLIRTFYLEQNNICFANSPDFKDVKHSELSAPSYEGINLDIYINTIDSTNQMHRLWTDGKWNKMTLAHGCYWHKCTFCDTTLDYIKRYESANAKLLCNRIENIILQTKQNGFHFTDEAAPPKLLKDLASELIQRNLIISWWTNIRFEQHFDNELCKLLKKSGCIALSGGIEVASDRLLKLINKGVTLKDIIKSTLAMRKNSILVHAYLMYGFPTQTEQETIDALEIVRQMFDNNLINSAYWHQFAMTVHSETGNDPDKFGVKRLFSKNKTFAENECKYTESNGSQHARYEFGLKKAIYNYMHKICINYNLQEWFDFKIPRTSISKDFVKKIAASKE